MSFLEALPDSVVLGPMTKGSNLPYRRLCVELGARITVSEMTVARRLKQKRRSEFALIRRAPDEPCFGVQLAGNQPDEMGWAAALVASRGAEFVDVNLGCPIDYFTSKGHGRRARPPAQARAADRRGDGARAGRRPGHGEDPAGMERQQPELPRGGAGRRWTAAQRPSSCTGGRAMRGTSSRRTGTRSARWCAPCRCRSSATATCSSRTRCEAARAQSGCAAVMVARGALIKPWLYREMTEGYRDLSADERLGDLPALRRARARALGRGGLGPRAGRRLHALALRLLVPVRAAPRGRVVAVDAGTRGRGLGAESAWTGCWSARIRRRTRGSPSGSSRATRLTRRLRPSRLQDDEDGRRDRVVVSG